MADKESDWLQCGQADCIGVQLRRGDLPGPNCSNDPGHVQWIRGVMLPGDEP
jgi:hypothetical protein